MKQNHPSYEELLAENERLRQRIAELVVPQLARQLGNRNECKSAFNQLLSMGKQAVSIFLQILSEPHTIVSGNDVWTWDANMACRLAAEGLGRLKASEAVEPLMKILVNSSDVVLQMKAIWALGEIGDARAVPALIPLLGDQRPVRGLRLSEHAADALRKLGEGELVEAFFQTLKGNQAALENLKGKHYPEAVEGLMRALDSHYTSRAANAAWALGELGAVEALSKLRSKVGAFSLAPERVKEACKKAIAKLEVLATLPRPAQAGVPSIETLPRPASVSEVSKETLPRPADADALTDDEKQP